MAGKKAEHRTKGDSSSKLRISRYTPRASPARISYALQREKIYSGKKDVRYMKQLSFINNPLF